MYFVVVIFLGLVITTNIIEQPKSLLELSTNIETMIGFITKIISNWFLMSIEILFLLYMVKTIRLEDISKGNLKYNLIFFTSVLFWLSVFILTILFTLLFKTSGPLVQKAAYQ